jgi:hypothetical protein
MPDEPNVPPGMGDADASGPTADAARKEADERRVHRLSIIAAIFLGLATVSSAWAAYQAARWSGVMATAFNEASIASTDAAKAYSEGDAKYGLDQDLFVEWIVALQSGDEPTAIYLQENLFSDELSVAVDAWAETGDDGPDTPFDTEDYVIEEWSTGDVYEAAALVEFNDARDANQTSDNYVLITVAFASTLFFAGIAGASQDAKVKVILLVFGGIMYLGALGIMLTQPVH